jgi:hypothetical protein
LAVLILWLVSVILTGSADSSILASDVETGKAIARLEDAHEYAFFFLLLIFAKFNTLCFLSVFIFLMFSVMQ